MMTREQIKQKWIDALRSRKYKQIKRKLFGNGNERCAMGVLYGINCAVSIPPGIAHEVIRRNDVKKQKFYQIARWLERNL